MARDRETADRVIASLGLRIAELRRALPATQQETADLAGMPLKDYQRVEHGKRNVTVSTLVRIARALNAPISCLFDVPSPAPRRGRGRPRKS